MPLISNFLKLKKRFQLFWTKSKNTCNSLLTPNNASSSGVMPLIFKLPQTKPKLFNLLYTQIVRDPDKITEKESLFKQNTGAH